MIRLMVLRCIPLRVGTLRPDDAVWTGRRGSLQYAGRGHLAICAATTGHPLGLPYRSWTRIYATRLCRARNAAARVRPQRRRTDTARDTAQQRMDSRTASSIGEITARSSARTRRKSFQRVRAHDLRQAYGRRLRAAGVSLQDRQDLLRHEAGRVTTHYSSAEVANLVKAANAVKKSRESPTRTVFPLISAEG